MTASIPPAASPPPPAPSPSLGELPPEGKTPSAFLVTAPYVKRKLAAVMEELEEAQEQLEKRGKRRTAGAGGLVGLLVMAGGWFFERHHEETDQAASIETRQQLRDFIASEKAKVDELQRHVDQLLDLQLKLAHEHEREKAKP